MSHVPTIVKAKYLKDYSIKVVFDNGEERIADCSKWLKGKIFQPLKNRSYFRKFFVDGWTIAWPNGADISPETIYEESQPA
jgi:hypothetical protein